MAIILRHRKKF